MQITPELIIALAGIIGAGLNYWYTKNKGAAEARDIDATAAGKLASAAATLSSEIQEHVVNELKHQLNIYSARIDRLEILTAHQEQLLSEQGHKIAEQDITIKEQGGIIMQLRQRVTDLEHENGRLKTENDQLKQRGGKL